MRFHLFDKIIQFDPGKSGVAVKNITVAEEFFIKHYDRNPLMPEPLIIEALAQTGGWTVAVTTQFRFVAILVRIDKARFLKPVRPGDQLILKTTILSINENGSLIEGTAELVATNDPTASAFDLGERVFHQKFGYGSIKNIDGNKLTVDFEKAGRKKVIASFVERH